MTQEERQQKFNLFLEGFGVATHIHIYTAPSPASMSILELLVSTGIALFLIYLFSSIWWVVIFIVIYWILNFLKSLSPFPDIPKATLRFDTDGIEQDNELFWTWEEIQNEKVHHDHPSRKRSFLDFIPSFLRLFSFLATLTISFILSFFLSFFGGAEIGVGFTTRLFPKEYYYFSFSTPKGTKIFILESEEIPQQNILPDYFEKYRTYHKIKKETFNL